VKAHTGSFPATSSEAHEMPGGCLAAQKLAAGLQGCRARAVRLFTHMQGGTYVVEQSVVGRFLHLYKQRSVSGSGGYPL